MIVLSESQFTILSVVSLIYFIVSYCIFMVAINHKLKETCKKELNVECIDVKQKEIEKKIMYSPIWKGILYSKEYIFENNQYYDEPCQIGQNETILINKNNPEEYLNPYEIKLKYQRLKKILINFFLSIISVAIFSYSPGLVMRGIFYLIFFFTLFKTLDVRKKYKKLKERCQTKIIVECIDIKKYNLFDNILYSPVWKGINNNQEYIFECNDYIPENFTVGETATILINSHDPTEYVDYTQVKAQNVKLILAFSIAVFVLFMSVFI